MMAWKISHLTGRNQPPHQLKAGEVKRQKKGGWTEEKEGRKGENQKDAKLSHAVISI